MVKKQTRLLSTLIALILVLNIIPIGQVFAANVDESVRYEDGLVVDGSTGWNSGGGDQYLLEGQFDVTITFKNEPFIKNNDNWSNFVFEIIGGANTKNYTFRADNYGWSFGEGSQEPTFEGTNSWNGDWDVFQTMCKANPIVTLNLKKTSDTTVIAYMEFKPSEEGNAAANQTYTITYPNGVPASMRVQVGADGGKITILEFKDNTTREDFTAGEGIGKASTSADELSGNFSIVYTFHNASQDTSAQWFNFVAEVWSEGFGITARADVYGWGYNGLADPGLTWETTPGIVNWDVFKADMANADVAVTITRIGSVITFTYDIKASNGNTYYFVGKTAELEIPDTLYTHMTGEKVKLSNIRVQIYHLPEEELPDEPTAEYPRDDLTIGAYLSGETAPDELVGNFKLVYTFNNATTDTSANWNNFVIQVWGFGFGINARADKFGSGYNCTDPGFTWESNVEINWDTFKTDMQNADVTVTIKRNDKVITFTYDIVALGSNNTYHIVGTTQSLTMPYTLKAHLTGEKVKLSNIYVKVYNDDVYDPSADDTISYGGVTDRVTVHDPSIIKDPKTGIYYIFGSHMAWAKSTDLIHWQTFTNNINRNYGKIFSEPAVWSSHGAKPASSYDVSGNLWAPDVIWNATMGKWCMYMSVNGDDWYTTTVLLTADNIEGPYTYVGPVVYSGFTSKDEALITDFYQVMKDKETFPTRYTEMISRRHSYGVNAIDPCVSYDEGGDLWMTYGSWFGGIYMLKLDPSTGLRDYSYTYETVTDKSDEYQGIKIAGGYTLSGEASYIEKIGDYWYLFMSYGGFVANGGYNMRVFRSENITGPYTDSEGNSAVYTKPAGNFNDTDNINGTVGNRLMTYYRWNYMDKAQVAQGHNSAMEDDDHRAYVVYHTRFNDGTEGHQVRVHQLFVSEDGWLVAAPFEYAGESLAAIDKNDVAGKYEVLFHTNTDYSKLECVTGQSLEFKANGTFSGAIEGTWVLDGYYVTLTSGSKTYKGVFVEQKMEEQDRTALCFTVIDNEGISVWGYKYPYSDEEFIAMAAENLGIPIGTFGQNITLPSAGLYNTTITWSSDNTAIITTAGKVTLPATDTVVNLTAAITYGNTTKNVKFPIKVFSSKQEETEKYLIWEYFTGENQDLSTAKEGDLQYPNPFNSSNVLGISIYNGVSIEFEVTSKGAMQHLSNILSLNAGEKGGLYFTGGSYLGYNATGGYFDANLQTGFGAGTDFIGSGAAIRIELSASGFKVYANGEQIYSQADVGGSVPGSLAIDSYVSMLNYLRETATYLNFGWGSWWDGGFNGTISNVKLYAEPIDWVDKSGYVYYEDYNSTSDTGWISPNAQDFLSIKNDGDSHAGYMDYAAQNENARGAYTNFSLEEALSSKYVVEVDIKLTPGNNQANTQFVITGTDAAYDSNNYNYGIVSGYILCLNQTAANSNVYSINGSTEQTITIPSNTWVHIKAVVGGSKDLLVEITVGEKTTAFTTTVNGSGVLKGLSAVKGRYYGTVSVDNIAVSTGFNYGEPEFIWSEDEKTASAVFHCNEWDSDTYNKIFEATVTSEVKTAATCKESGIITYTATVEFEGKTYTNTKDFEISPIEHTEGEPVREKEKAATCTEDGSYEEVVYCTVCGEELNRESKTVEATGHTQGDAVRENEKAATCTESGSYDEVVYCTKCDKELSRTTKAIDKLPHTHGEAVKEDIIEATCTDEGSYYEVVYCTVCKAELSREKKTVAALGHTRPADPAIESDDEAVCGEMSTYYEVYYCTVCGEELERSEPKTDFLPHNPGAPVRENEVPATCSTEGSYEEVVCCTKCAKEISRTSKTIDKLPHTPGDAVKENVVDATCTAEGSYDEVVYCTVCRAELSREAKTVAKLPHTSGEAVRENIVDATCAAEGSYDEVVYCTVCKAELSRETKTVAKLSHTSGEAVKENVVDATCAAEGSYDEVVYCTVCKAELSREAKTVAKLPHTSGEAVKENVVDATCAAEGSYDEVVYCTVCKAELSRETKTVAKLSHTSGVAVRENVVNATCAAAGSYDEVVYCTVCKAELSRETKTVAKLSHAPGEAVRENVVNATCTAAGSYDEVVYCTLCKAELSRETESIAKLTHTVGTPVTENLKEATETNAGSFDQVSYCTVCGKEVKRSVKTIPPIGQSDSVQREVVIGEDAPRVNIPTVVEELKNTVLNKEEKEAVEKGAYVEIVLNVEIKEDVEPEYVTVVEEVTEGKYVIGQYLELDLNIYVDNEINRAVTLTEEPIQITIDIPEDMFSEKREYVIIREHDGTMDILEDIDNDPRTITFETDRFSTYVIGYSDDAEEEITEPTEPAEPSEPTEPAEPTEPSEPAEPNEPIEPSQPTEPPAESDDNIPNTGNEPNMAAVMFLSLAALFGAVCIKRRAM